MAKTEAGALCVFFRATLKSITRTHKHGETGTFRRNSLRMKVWWECRVVRRMSHDYVMYAFYFRLFLIGWFAPKLVHVEIRSLTIFSFPADLLLHYITSIIVLVFLQKMTIIFTHTHRQIDVMLLVGFSCRTHLIKTLVLQGWGCICRYAFLNQFQTTSSGGDELKNVVVFANQLCHQIIEIWSLFVFDSSCVSELRGSTARRIVFKIICFRCCILQYRGKCLEGGASAATLKTLFLAGNNMIL